MSLRAGRVGVNPADVDPITGRISPEASEGYTKSEADDKFLSKSDASSTYESKTEASEAHNLLQPKTLAVPIEMLSGSKLTVESALQGLNSEKMSYADNGVLGAKNILPNDYSVSAYGTKSGVTFTDNGNGIIGVSDAATADITNELKAWTGLFSGKHILSGCPSGGSATTYSLIIQNTSTWESWRDTGEGVEIDFDPSIRYSIKIVIKNTVNMNGKVFKPMIRLVTDTDDTYVPYAMTNRELTEKKLDVSVLKSITSDATDFSAFKTAIANL